MVYGYRKYTCIKTISMYAKQIEAMMMMPMTFHLPLGYLWVPPKDRPAGFTRQMHLISWKRWSS